MQHKLESWNILKEKYQININSNETIPNSVNKNHRVIGMKYNNEFHDIWRPTESSKLEEKDKVKYLTFDDIDGKYIFWHTSAHILGYALEKKYNAQLCFGPPIENGFYYDFKVPEDIKVTKDDFADLQMIIDNFIKQNHIFERIDVSKDDARVLFKDNKFKLHVIDNLVKEGELCSVYKCGDFVDLCEGPHLEKTSMIKAYNLEMISSSYFLNDNKQDKLFRIYGISFPSTKEMKIHIKFKEEAHKRDHRRLGNIQELFMFHKFSPGSCFYLPHGMRIYNKLLEFMKKQYWTRGFDEVKTPVMCNSDLWKISGHWDKYRENMFTLSVDQHENQEQEHQDNYALCAMNCPKHCLIYQMKPRYTKDLPIRLADFGVLHRNEESGSLSGLTRVRMFCQDDAHIFCTQDQIKDEMANCLEFLMTTYKIFGFEYILTLSTRPEKYIGEIETWDMAENQLKMALNNTKLEWNTNEGDGAFYGPKIDILIKDALGRRHQCATIQLDFNLPERFELEYTCGSFVNRPVMIHRAIYGSFDRFMSILVEHFGGKFQFWLSPRQIMIIPVSEKNNDYAQKVHEILHQNNFYVDVDLSDNKLNHKIASAQSELYYYNYILVVGFNEEKDDTVNIRVRGNNKTIILKLDDTIDMFNDDIKNYR